jgi:acetoacetate decarboxylase
MGFVKTDEEIAAIQARLAEPRFLSAQLLTVQYRTRPEIVRRVLPPGLEPTAQPVATVMLGHWGRSNVCHAFSGACFYVQARHEEHVGDYCLAMQMSTDAAIIFGREVFGEPKKYAKTTLERSGSAFRGRVERYGIPIIRIDATMQKKETPAAGGFINFHYKFLPKCDGRGLEADPVLVMATFETKPTLIESGNATLTLANNALDPLGEIEIVEVLGASYVEADTYSRCQALARVDAKAFLPYAYSKLDDYASLDNEAEAPWGQVLVA